MMGVFIQFDCYNSRLTDDNLCYFVISEYNVVGQMHFVFYENMEIEN